MPNHFRRELIVSLAIVGGSILIFASILYFLSEDLSFQAEKVVADRALINQRAAILGALADLKKDASQADIYKRAMDKILVLQDQLLDFPHWLDGLSRAHQVGLSFSFQGSQVPPQGETPGYIAFSLDLTGKLGDLIDFLKDVEFQSPRFLVSLDNVGLTKGDSAYRISSQGRVFFR